MVIPPRFRHERAIVKASHKCWEFSRCLQVRTLLLRNRYFSIMPSFSAGQGLICDEILRNSWKEAKNFVKIALYVKLIYNQMYISYIKYIYIFFFLFSIENATNIVSLNILTSRKITRGIAIIAVLVINSTWCRRSIKYSPLALKEHVTFITYTCQPSRTKFRPFHAVLAPWKLYAAVVKFYLFSPREHIETIPFTFIYENE